MGLEVSRELHWAASLGDVEGIRDLLAAKASPVVFDAMGQTPLHVAAFSKCPGATEAVVALLKARAPVTAVGYDGETALCCAVKRNCRRTVAALLANKADPNAAKPGSPTPLHTAATQGFLRTTELLLAAKADCMRRERSRNTPLHCACRNNQPECVEVLIRAGCDVGPKNIDGMTGRELAEAAGHVGVVALLRTVVAEQ